MAEVSTTGPGHLQLHLAKQMVLGVVVCKDGGQLNNVELQSILEEMRPMVQMSRYSQHFSNKFSCTLTTIQIQFSCCYSSFDIW